MHRNLAHWHCMFHVSSLLQSFKGNRENEFFLVVCLKHSVMGQWLPSAALWQVLAGQRAICFDLQLDRKDYSSSCASNLELRLALIFQKCYSHVQKDGTTQQLSVLNSLYFGKNGISWLLSCKTVWPQVLITAQNCSLHAPVWLLVNIWCPSLKHTNCHSH